ncbi:MAG: PEP-CTERM sorting domain-containing protein [Phycisphaerae bacterium]|nr:PEP-CTERM sorting domain-containing protein [Phycisphaerae bacterium]
MRMRNAGTVIFVMMLICCFELPKAVGTIYFDDGQIHNIETTINDDIWVDYEAPGMETTVNLIFGGEVDHMKAYNNSLVNVFDGLINQSLDALDSSRVNISGGTIMTSVFATSNSQLSISGGLIKSSLNAQCSSQITISSGQIDDHLVAYADSRIFITGGYIGSHLQVNHRAEVTISGGTIQGFVENNGSEQITISGGSIGGDIWAGSGSDDEGVITFVGSDFAINGLSVDYGQYFHSDFASGILTGTLSNGDTLNNGFYIHDNAAIVLIPEPATLLLLGLGVSILRIKRR